MKKIIRNDKLGQFQKLLAEVHKKQKRNKEE